MEKKKNKTRSKYRSRKYKSKLYYTIWYPSPFSGGKFACCYMTLHLYPSGRHTVDEEEDKIHQQRRYWVISIYLMFFFFFYIAHRLRGRRDKPYPVYKKLFSQETEIRFLHKGMITELLQTQQSFFFFKKRMTKGFCGCVFIISSI